MGRNPEALATVVIRKDGLGIILARLGALNSPEARNLFVRTAGNWGWHPGRQYASMKITKQEQALLQSLQLPKGAISTGSVVAGWVAVYRHPRNKSVEITVKSVTKPPKRKMFLIKGTRKRLVAVSVRRINSTKEAVMAAKSRSRKAVEEDDLDELEGLEDLDDLEDLEDEEEEDEELEDEEDEEEDEDEEDEEPAPKRGRKPAAKKAAPAKKAPARKKAVVEDDDDEDEDEEPAPRRKKATSTAKPAAKAPAKAAKNGGGGLPTTRELPKGKVGPQDIADLVGGDCDARYVRIWLRDSDYEREEGGRWAFSKTDARDIVRDIKAARKKSTRISKG